MPPKYHWFVPPYPIYVYDAVFYVFYLSDLPNPNNPFILNYFGTFTIKWQDIGKSNIPYSFA